MGYEEVLQSLAQSRQAWLREPDLTRKSQMYQNYAMDTANFLTGDEFGPQAHHWFCDKSTRLYALDSLIALSYSPQSETMKSIELYKNSLSSMLGACADCALAYERGKKELVSQTLSCELQLNQNGLRAFLRMLNQGDRARLVESVKDPALRLNAVMEIVENFSCYTMTSFLQETLEKSYMHQLIPLMRPAAPGYISLLFNTWDSTLRQLVLSKLDSNALVNAWDESPDIYEATLNNSLNKNIHASALADFAWYNAAILVQLLKNGRKDLGMLVYDNISGRVATSSEMVGFGLHFLLAQGVPSSDAIEKVLSVPLQAKSIFKNAPEVAKLDKNYSLLDASCIVSWVQRQDEMGPAEYVLSLERDYFLSNESYDHAATSIIGLCARLIRSKNSKLQEKAFNTTLKYSKRISESISGKEEGIANDIGVLVSYQVMLSIDSPETDVARSDFSFWELEIRQTQHGSDGTLFVPYLLEILAHVGEAALAFGTQPNKTQESIQLLLESMVDRMNTAEQAEVVLNPRIWPTLVLLAMSPLRNLALASADVLIEPFSAENNPAEALRFCLEKNPKLVVSTLIQILENSMNPNRFEMFNQILRYAAALRDTLYDPLITLDSSVKEALNNNGLLLRLWEASWEFISFIVANVRAWGGAHSIHAIKSLLFAVLDYSQGLLDRFRLVEADLPMAQDNGAKLVKPVLQTTESMGGLLALSVTELLDRAHCIMVSLTKLMISFKIPIPESQIERFKRLASGKDKSKLTQDQLSELLSSTQLFKESEIESILTRKTQNSSPFSSASSSALSSTHPSTLPSTLPSKKEFQQHRNVGQSQLDDFFKQTKTIPRPPLPKVNSKGVIPSAPQKQSKMEELKQRMQIHHHPASIDEPVAVHPARPAGFNSKRTSEQQAPPTHRHTKPQVQPEDESSGDEDEEDEESGLHVLGRKIRNFERTNRTAPGLAGRPGKPPLQLTRDQEMVRMRLRLSIEPTALHRAILSWDYFSSSAYPSEFRPNLGVPDQFMDIEHYMKVMEPLLHLEAWQQLQRTQSELRTTKPVMLTIGKRVSCDDFLDVYVSVSRQEFSESRVNDSDVVIVGYSSDPESLRSVNAEMPHCLAKVKEGSVRFQQKVVDLELRFYHAHSLIRYLEPGRLLLASRVCSLTTVEREYCALRALEYFDLKQDILAARPSPLTGVSNSYPSEQMMLNDSQLSAVEHAISSTGFNLIQGPPGTGKTKTILGIVGSYFRGGKTNKRLLLCAPSNAAVDELVLRLKGGGALDPYSGKPIKDLNIVRLGRLDVINQLVKECSLEEQVKKSITNQALPIDSKLKEQHNELLSKRESIRRKIEAEGYNADLQAEVSQLSRQIREIRNQLASQRDQITEARRTHEREYRQVMHNILQGSHVVCTTLSGSANSTLASQQLLFSTVIIDEAAQCIELSALIPLKYGAKKCIMVGDPNQLPPTVISQEAAKLKYEQSLFVRMFHQHSNDVSMLDTQFRMHPDISRFPSKEFYQGRLKDGPSMAEKSTRPWHASDLFAPYRFFAVQGKMERSKSTMSYQNRHEADEAARLVRSLLETYPNYDFSGQIGVISPYRQQISTLRDRFKKILGRDAELFCDFSSIDGFQGQEKDIIILSCVRAERDAGGVGFVGDIRRMNVAITRARTSLWILGHPETLMANPVWKGLITDAQERGCYHRGIDLSLARAKPKAPANHHPDRLKKKKETEEAAPNHSQNDNLKEALGEDLRASSETQNNATEDKAPKQITKTSEESLPKPNPNDGLHVKKASEKSQTVPPPPVGEKDDLAKQRPLPQKRKGTSSVFITRNRKPRIRK